MHYLKQCKWHLIPQFLLVAMVAIIFILSDYQTSEAATLSPQTNTTHCKSLGALIESEPIMDGSTKIGEIDVYYNKSTGYNCAYAKSSGSTWGKKKSMTAWISSCKETKPNKTGCTTIKDDVDSGMYSYEAGPVGVSGKGHCISAQGAIIWHGKRYYANLKPIVGHC